MKRNEIIFIIVLLAIVSIAIGMTQPTKIPFLKFWESSSKAAPDGKGALKLDENGELSGISISAEDLYINGKLGASTAVVSEEVLERSGQEFINQSVTTNSKIFITITCPNTVGQWLRVNKNEIYNGSFKVRTMNDDNPSYPIDFNYLIIN